jgi:hypothetical protein
MGTTGKDDWAAVTYDHTHLASWVVDGRGLDDASNEHAVHVSLVFMHNGEHLDIIYQAPNEGLVFFDGSGLRFSKTRGPSADRPRVALAGGPRYAEYRLLSHDGWASVISSPQSSAYHQKP